MAKSTIIKERPKAGPFAGLLLSALFAVSMTAIATAERWLVSDDDFAIGEPAPVTVRVPPFRGMRDVDSSIVVGGGSIVIARGDVVDASEAQVIGLVYGNGVNPITTWAAYGGAFFLMALLYTGYLRRSSRGRLLRVQLVSLALTVGLAATVKALLLASSASLFLVPVAAGAVVAALAIDLYVGLATALLVAAAAGLVAPFDAGVVAVLVAQGVATVLCIGDGRRNTIIVLAAIFGGIAAAMAYSVFYYLSQQDMPLHELADPTRSAWLAAFVGGAASGLIAIVSLPIYQWLLGEITKNRLVELADLSNPLLKQIAEKSPGTWQHSLAMANMAEVGANTIGANGRLVRVGAYYHDLGKSLQPKYFIENLTAGETSPHDALPPEVSCDAIFAHVTEGVRLGRKEALPERVIDFMHMHHGDGLLEYFWNKCQEQGNPQQLHEDDFRYPGVKPQTRETAILAICDAVEAASRTLKQPDARSIENLVQRIVYGKLHLGQLDESGLSMRDLRRLSNSLIETIKHAHHVRVEYPWQREQREAEARERAEEQRTAAASPRAQEALAQRVAGAAFTRSPTQRVVTEPPLDSLDVPRAYWRRARRADTKDEGALGNAPTERVSTGEALAYALDENDQAPPRDPLEQPTQVEHAAPADDTTSPLRARPDAETVPAPIAEEAAAGAPDPHKRVTRPVDVVDGPSTPPPMRAKPVTIELMKPDGTPRDDAPKPLAPLVDRDEPHVETHRAQSEDGSLEPGVMVVGPPPKTQARRRAPAKDDDER